jgi:hypothetical protein
MSEQDEHPWRKLPYNDPRRVLARLLYRLPERMSCRDGFDPEHDTPRTDFEEVWKEAYECWKKGRDQSQYEV